MKIIELFAGIGACSKALENIGIDLEIVDAVEIDKYAMKSFNAIHRTNFEVQDITKWDKDFKDIDLITHGSPCQDFSLAGKQAGGDIGSGTRSSLMYETIRIVGKIRPKYVLWENVKNVLSKKHKHNFDNYINTMNILGYNSYYQVLNAKNYGIPQNRKRVFTVSIRKDIDNGEFIFPEKEELKLRLKDMLEDEVDEKYYLSEYQIENIKKSNFNTNKRRIQKKEYCDTLCARDWKDPKCIQVYDIKLSGAYGRKFGSKGKMQKEICDTLQAAMGNGGGNIPIVLRQVGQIYGTEREPNPQAGRVYDSNGISPTMDSCNGGNRQPKIEVLNKKAKHQQDLLQDKNDLCRTIPAGTHGSTPHLLKTIINNNPLQIRKLTPKECWRLMRFF